MMGQIQNKWLFIDFCQLTQFLMFYCDSWRVGVSKIENRLTFTD